MHRPVSSNSRVTCDQVVEQLRDAIVQGRLTAGQRLPSHTGLVADTGASLVTVQRAVEQLADQGFIHSRHGLGRFVVDRPPHLFDFGLMFSSHPSENTSGWSNFYRVMHDEAVQIARADLGKRLHVFYDVHPDEGCKGYQDLLKAVDRNQLAGLIFTGGPYFFAGKALVQSTKVAHVSVSAMRDAKTGIRSVCSDSDSFLTRAYERLAKLGCRRAATLLAPGFCRDELIQTQGVHQYVADKARAAGLQTETHLAVLVDPKVPEGSRQIVRLLMELPVHRRPDGLVFADDHLARAVGAGLLDAGVKVGRDFHVIGLANFPMVPECPVPVTWLGPDVGLILWSCLETLEKIRQGVTVPDSTRLPAMFHDEFLQQRRVGKSAEFALRPLPEVGP